MGVQICLIGGGCGIRADAYVLQVSGSGLLGLARCKEAAGLETWCRRWLAPYYAPAATVGHFDASSLTDIAGDVPILEGVPTATCVWAGRLGAIACWQAAREHGVVVARAATAPKQDLSISTPHRRGAPLRLPPDVDRIGRRLQRLHPRR